MPDMNANTPDAFSGTVLFRGTKPSRYKARLLLWQWKQWLNIGTDWNNHSVCPLVPQTSCSTELNPCWCRTFRPVSVSLFFFVFNLVLLFFRLSPGPHCGSLVTGVDKRYVACRKQCAQPLDGGRRRGVKKRKRHWRGGQTQAGLGERWNKHEIEG